MVLGYVKNALGSTHMAEIHIDFDVESACFLHWSLYKIYAEKHLIILRVGFHYAAV